MEVHKQLFPRNQYVAAVEEKKVEIIFEKHGLFKAERCHIKKDNNSTFFSTDNGVLKLSATVIDTKFEGGWQRYTTTRKRQKPLGLGRSGVDKICRCRCGLWFEEGTQKAGA